MNLLRMKGAQQAATEVPILFSLNEGDYGNTHHTTALLQGILKIKRV